MRGTIPDPALGAVDPARYLAAAEALARALRQGSQPRYRFLGARLKAAQDVLQRRIIAETLQRQGRVIPCHAGRLNLVLDERGELYPCEEFSLRLGNVRDHDFDVRATARIAAGPRGSRFDRPRRVLVHARVLHDDQHPLQPAELPRPPGGVPPPAPQ